MIIILATYMFCTDMECYLNSDPVKWMSLKAAECMLMNVNYIVTSKTVTSCDVEPDVLTRITEFRLMLPQKCFVGKMKILHVLTSSTRHLW